MSLEDQINDMGRKARQAARRLAILSQDQKNAILRAMADELVKRAPQIVEENARDIAHAEPR